MKNEFKPMQWVLSRDKESEQWTLAQFSHMDGGKGLHPYVVCGGIGWDNCIPYEGNEQLLGTTDPYEPPYEPKDGDFVVVEEHREEESLVEQYLCIFRSLGKSAINFYAGLDENGILFRKGDPGYYTRNLKEHYRLATEEEKQLILSKLHEIGKNWCDEWKEIVDLKWKPVDKGKYYFVNSVLVVDNANWCGNLLDIQRHQVGNCFRTYEEARALCEGLIQTFKNVK